MKPLVPRWCPTGSFIKKKSPPSPGAQMHDGTSKPYQVVDNPSRLTKSEWCAAGHLRLSQSPALVLGATCSVADALSPPHDRARVAVLFVANGSAWQFKAFPHKRIPVDVFRSSAPLSSTMAPLCPNVTACELGLTVESRIFPCSVWVLPSFFGLQARSSNREMGSKTVGGVRPNVPVAVAWSQLHGRSSLCNTACGCGIADQYRPALHRRTVRWTPCPAPPPAAPVPRSALRCSWCWDSANSWSVRCCCCQYKDGVTQRV